VPVADVSTLDRATGGMGVKSASALASKLVADATTNEGAIGRSVVEETTPVGCGQREATGDCAVSGEALFDSFGSAPLGSTDVAGVVGELFRSATTMVCGDGNSAWASAAGRASLVSLTGATVELASMVPPGKRFRLRSASTSNAVQCRVRCDNTNA